MSSTTVLVIGGSGFIGSKVVEYLVKNNVDVLSCDIVALNPIVQNLKLKLIRADILELSSIERIFFEYDIDTVIHLVGLPAIDYCEKNPHFSLLLNALSVHNTLEAMRKTDVKKIVFASSAAVYGYHSKVPVKETVPANPTTVYGYHKLIAEHLIKSYNQSYGLNYVTLRLFNVYGGDPEIGKDVISIFIRRAIKGMPIVVRGPSKYRDFVHVNDVVNAIMKVALTEISNVTINIGTGKMTTLQEIANMVKRCFPKVEIKYEAAPDDGTGLIADIALAKEILGFSPVDPQRGIYEHIASYANSVY
jgi:UDP-glucose 4-epimerase